MEVRNMKQAIGPGFEPDIGRSSASGDRATEVG